MIQSRCGIQCGECGFRESAGCKGCVNIDKPFWGEKCEVKSCCEGKKLAHCGECKDFPCELLNSFAFDEQQGDGGKRIDTCRIWAGISALKYGWIDEHLLSKSGVTRNLQRDWNWIRYCIEDKMFAAVCLDWSNKPVYITLKLVPEEGEFLRSRYEDILPGYYMNKRHWNSVKAEGDVPSELLREMLDKSYDLVLSGFSKKKQRELAGL